MEHCLPAEGVKPGDPGKPRDRYRANSSFMLGVLKTDQTSVTSFLERGREKQKNIHGNIRVVVVVIAGSYAIGRSLGSGIAVTCCCAACGTGTRARTSATN
jgi:hypothetical protein